MSIQMPLTKMADVTRGRQIDMTVSGIAITREQLTDKHQVSEKGWINVLQARYYEGNERWTGDDGASSIHLAPTNIVTAANDAKWTTSARLGRCRGSPCSCTQSTDGASFRHWSSCSAVCTTANSSGRSS